MRNDGSLVKCFSHVDRLPASSGKPVEYDFDISGFRNLELKRGEELRALWNPSDVKLLRRGNRDHPLLRDGGISPLNLLLDEVLPSRHGRGECSRSFRGGRRLFEKQDISSSSV